MYETTGMRQVGNLWELTEDLHGSPYYNDDLAPTTTAQRTWNTWHIAALWIGMAVCVPTYTLSAGMISQGMNWWQAVLTVFLGNVIVLIPMCLNAHAGTKYGVPFPVLLRAPFGVWGSNIPALLRAIVACGWFGIQTWFGGLAIYMLACAFFPEWRVARELTLNLDVPPLTGTGGATLHFGLNFWQAACFLLFWLINVFVIARGIACIKWLESWSAPLLIGVGIALLVWAQRAEGIRGSLERSRDFAGASISVDSSVGGESGKVVLVTLKPVRDEKAWRAKEYRLATSEDALATTDWKPIPPPSEKLEAIVPFTLPLVPARGGTVRVCAQFRGDKGVSSVRVASAEYAPAGPDAPAPKEAPPAKGFGILFWPNLTAMIAFWATLSLNIPDFTRYAKSQKSQVMGQVLGLPTTMALYSFIGIAVTCAAVGAFSDILVTEDAPWDPVNLLGRFKSPDAPEALQAWIASPLNFGLFAAVLKASWVTLVAMIALIIATLTTNVAANVVSPANDFSNLAPTKISFKWGGYITALIGVLIVPWKLLETTQGYIFTWLIGYSALLAPIGGIMIADYYLVRRSQLRLPDLYKRYGLYRYCGGTSILAVFVLLVAILPNIPGFLVTSEFWSHQGLVRFITDIAMSLNTTIDANLWATRLVDLYQVAWFTGFGIALVLYTLFGLIVRKV